MQKLPRQKEMDGLYKVKEGTKVKLIGVTDRNDKQVYGKILQYDPYGLAIVETEHNVIGVIATEVEEVK